MFNGNLEVARDKFEISYVDSSFSTGDYFEDRFEIGGAVVQNLTMGLGMKTNIPYGLVGVGYTVNEASLSTMGCEYPNLPVAMQHEGLINSIAYSLWLNDLDANTGNILFGGVDTAKYTGPLTKIDVWKEVGAEYQSAFAIAATDFNSTDTKIVPFLSKGAPIPSATAAGDHKESAVPPLPTTTGLIAAEGFQDGDELDDGAMALSKFTLTGIITVAISTALLST
ncbi:aspartic-type endopeptidase-like protein [Emericellopsis cladophorae]|uniref:Aspartic-type endopeptidase-like protein n=1 Tax=Emericellopsis cladophorae TaxID=2686198 RepID=A0A9P9Y536_9HYPO|nr:aspartic-type endopeptidase-like protein [Emericellopsis cladophorae]KAI6783180.1 aspartic-type endopeptidase-like protein [Emericellopsis cladophorae]